MQYLKKKQNLWKLVIWAWRNIHKFFLSLEINHAIQSKIHYVINNQGEIMNQAEIDKELFSFYLCFHVKCRIKETV